HGGSNRRPPVPPPPSGQLFRYSPFINSSRVTFQQPHAKDISKVQRLVKSSKAPVNTTVMRRENSSVTDCQMEKVGHDCFPNQTKETIPDSRKLHESRQQRGQTAVGNMTTPHDSKEAEAGEAQKDKAT
ncbi:hypothetical protein CRUP_009902, partial [Coryphaenoides rupestris]